MQEFTFENFIEYLKIPAKARTEEQIESIKAFIKQQNFLELLLKNKLSEIDENSIFLSFASCMEIQYINKDEILFRMDDYADKFFIILQGKIDIQIPYRKKFNLSRFEYFKFLEKLLYEREIGIVKLILNSNYEKISFENYSEFFDYAKAKAKILLGSQFREIKDHFSLQNFFNENLNVLRIFKIAENFDDVNYFKKANLKCNNNYNIRNIEEELLEIFSSNSEKDSSFSDVSDENGNEGNDKNRIYNLKSNKSESKFKRHHSKMKIVKFSDKDLIKIQNLDRNKNFNEDANDQNNNNVKNEVKRASNSGNKMDFQDNQNHFSSFSLKEDKNLISSETPKASNKENIYFKTNPNTNKQNYEISNLTNKKSYTFTSSLISKNKNKDKIIFEDLEESVRKSTEAKFSLTQNEEEALKKYTLMENQFLKLDYNLFLTTQKTLSQKDFFGDYALDSISKKRTATACCTEQNTILGFIPKDIYYESIFLRNQKNIMKNIQVLNGISFFKKIGTSDFRKNHFKQFKLKKLLKGEALLESTSELREIYFIKEGKVDVTLYISVFEIQALIDEILDKIVDFSFLTLVDNQLKILEELKIKVISQNSLKKEQLENLRQRRNVNLFTLEASELIGLEPFLLKMKVFYKVVPVSEKLAVYGLNVKNFDVILAYYPDCKQSFEKLALNKCFVVLTRLSNIKNSILNLSNFKFGNNNASNCVNNLNYDGCSNINNKEDFSFKRQNNNNNNNISDFYKFIKPQKRNLSENRLNLNKGNDQSENYNYQNTNNTHEKTSIKEFNDNFSQNNNNNFNFNKQNEISEFRNTLNKNSSSSLNKGIESIGNSRFVEKINCDKNDQIDKFDHVFNQTNSRNINFSENLNSEENSSINNNFIHQVISNSNYSNKLNNNDENFKSDLGTNKKNNKEKNSKSILPLLNFGKIKEENNKKLISSLSKNNILNKNNNINNNSNNYKDQIEDTTNSIENDVDQNKIRTNNIFNFTNNFGSSINVKSVNSIPLKERVKISNYPLTARNNNYEKNCNKLNLKEDMRDNTNSDYFNDFKTKKQNDSEPTNTKSNKNRSKNKNFTCNESSDFNKNILEFREKENEDKIAKKYNKTKNELLGTQTLLENSHSNSPKFQKDYHENLFFFNKITKGESFKQTEVCDLNTIESNENSSTEMNNNNNNNKGNDNKFKEAISNISNVFLNNQNNFINVNVNNNVINNYNNINEEKRNFSNSLGRKKPNLFGSVSFHNRFSSMIDLPKEVNTIRSTNDKFTFTNEGVSTHRNSSNYKINNLFNININQISNIYFNPYDRMDIENYSNTINKGNNTNHNPIENSFVKNSLLFNNNNNNNNNSDLNFLKDEAGNNKYKRRLVILNKTVKVKKEKFFNSDKNLFGSSALKNSNLNDASEDHSVHVKQFDDIEFDTFTPKINKLNNTLKNIQNLRNRIKESNVKKVNKNK